MALELILTIGLPASGKTTWAEQYIQVHPEYINVNRDDIRLSMQGRGRYNKFSKWREDMVTKIAYATAEAAFEAGKSVIISDTNLNPGRNKAWKEFAKKFDANYREQKFIDVHVGVCCERDAKREHAVGSKVIMGFFERGQGIWWDKPVYNPDLPDCYLVDIDGTIAQMHGRGPYDWDKVDTDLPKEHVINVINALSNRSEIIVVSGRDGVCKDMSEEWMNKHNLMHDNFYIRPEGDSRKDTVIKEEIYETHIKGKYNVIGVFDDRDQVVHMWRHLGLTVFQVNYGNF